MTAVGQKRRFDRLPFTSGLLPSTDIVGVRRHVANVPMADVPALVVVRTGTPRGSPPVFMEFLYFGCRIHIVFICDLPVLLFVSR